MARQLSEKVGRGPCPTCDASVTFRKSSGGMLTHKCDNCDSSGYAEPGGMAYTVRMASIQKDKTTPEPVPKAPNEPKPEAPPQPTKKARNSVFDMSTI